MLLLSLLLSKYLDFQGAACIEEAVYFEARGEPFIGQLYVANVIENRRYHKRFPNTTCAVVHQRGQFTYKFDPVKYEKDQLARNKARFISYFVQISPRLLPKNVVYYTANRVKYFEDKRGITKYRTLANHTFYQEEV